ncbi:anhydro-N-acetylmuramic acid kinase [Massilia sp. MB5]|uniref:anhydro-N-acetylmuramic acid kinase n=1 Tax=Massilia sp. MB5 TaxID=2919578 RepID=UPI001F0F873E|nr:anhydro-N-acetylmuramic acid kinase [Massilia sp. MB5]UMR32667.1 anhydro-N-acetylmuramic acid kinase [Massilia sp. MB5]
MSLFIGLMSGTSLDGVDGVLVDFWAGATRTMAAAHVPFAPALRAELLALQTPGANEIEREALAANQLAIHYADCVTRLLGVADIKAADVRAVGAHGQTVRHRPELGYTRQSNNPALLAELCGIDVIADFRSRDVAAGGQGAPLVPAFHHSVFGAAGKTRVVANIGGIANISVLHGDGRVGGFDTGPGNVLLDGWIQRHQGQPYDANGAWAAGGQLLPGLLAALLAEPYLALPAPKSTGRDLFHLAWLDAHLAAFPGAAPQDVMHTLTQYTAQTLADAIGRTAPAAEAVYVCGGGAHNAQLLAALQAALGTGTALATTDALGIPPQHVEALAFAWLAWRCQERQPGNLPAVTGAQGERILGAHYPR